MVMDRFARQRLIPEWDQNSLQKATVVLIGVGALGNEVARILTQSGIGRLILCDPDVIETSNLNRCILFRPEDIGRLKVQAAASALKEIAPEIEIHARPVPLAQGVGLAELRDADLVVSCLDSRAARLQLAGRCQLVQSPMVDGGTHPWGGEVRPYLDPQGPCYGCGLSEEKRSETDAPWSCIDGSEEAPAPSGAPSSALVGTWMAMVSVRFLMNLRTPNAIVRIDGATGSTTHVVIQRDPACPLHAPLGTPTRIAVSSEDAKLGALRSHLNPGDVPLAWEPIEQMSRCSSCGWTSEEWRVSLARPCPRCGHGLQIRTTMEIGAEIPDSVPLSTLGIAPREILAVRGSELRLLELGGVASISEDAELRKP